MIFPVFLKIKQSFERRITRKKTIKQFAIFVSFVLFVVLLCFEFKIYNLQFSI